MSIQNPKSKIQNLEHLLGRPHDQRLREYKYRFSQSTVFGLPVIALEFYGSMLGPADSERWVSLLQALLAGWVVYVNLGMFVEGVRLHNRSVRADLIVTTLAIGLYFYSLVSAMAGIITSHLLYRPLLFHACVMLLAAWTGWRWWQISRRMGVTG
ncbi:MAG: hypothetical protein ABIP55_15400 [Tepidisphaeraceae bacterium]